MEIKNSGQVRELSTSVVKAKELHNQSDERREKVEEKEESKITSFFLDWRTAYTMN